MSGRRKETIGVSGSIYLNGQEVARERLNIISPCSIEEHCSLLATILMNKCGYIEQNEMFIGSMTVREHLTFQV